MCITHQWTDHGRPWVCRLRLRLYLKRLMSCLQPSKTSTRDKEEILNYAFKAVSHLFCCTGGLTAVFRPPNDSAEDRPPDSPCRSPASWLMSVRLWKSEKWKMDGAVQTQTRIRKTALITDGPVVHLLSMHTISPLFFLARKKILPYSLIQWPHSQQHND